MATVAPGVARPNWSANASGSGSRASPGASSSTNSNGRSTLAAVTGGVSHRYAWNGASIRSDRKNKRNSASSRQRSITSRNATREPPARMQ